MDARKYECLASRPDEYEAAGLFVIRPEWNGDDNDDDSWEVARPTTRRGKLSGIYPAAVCICPDRAHAAAVRDALNAFISTPSA